jgi:hypothetical protein
MSTSNRTSVRDTLVAAGVAAVIALVISPADPSLASLPVHTAWIVAIILAARYGSLGLYGIPAVMVGVQAAVFSTGRADLAILDRLQRPGDLIALMAVGLVGVIGALHEARVASLAAKLRTAEKRANNAEVAVEDLADASIALRDRCDRSNTSLAFLSDIAVRMDSPDPAGAGDAALTLAMARTGARGGFVQLLDGHRLKTLCSRGMWSAERLAPPAVFRDAVAHAALDRNRPVAAHEIASASQDDSDLAAPLLDASGKVVGVLALRGISYPALSPAAREDLAAVARWAARAFARPLHGAPAVVRGEARAT